MRSCVYNKLVLTIKLFKHELSFPVLDLFQASVVIFGNALSERQWIGASLVFAGNILADGNFQI